MLNKNIFIYRKNLRLHYIDSMGEFTTTNETNIHTAIFGTSYNKNVRPSATTSVDIE